MDCKQCKEKILAIQLVGACQNGLCPHKVKSMCDKCAKWDVNEQKWFCKLCIDLRLQRSSQMQSCVFCDSYDCEYPEYKRLYQMYGFVCSDCAPAIK